MMFAATAALAQDTLPAKYDIFTAGLDEALTGIKMLRTDLALRDDYLEKDPYRMAEIDRVMNAPLSMLSTASKLVGPGSVDNIVFPIFRSSPYPPTIKPRMYESLLPHDVLAEYYSRENLDSITTHRLAYFIERIKRISADAIYDEINRNRFDSIITGYALLLEENAGDEFKSIDELDSIANYEEDWTKKLVDLTRTVDAEVAALRCLEFLEIFSDSIINDINLNDFPGGYVQFKTPWGKVCVGDTSSQYYFGDIFLVIDYGGDDVYDIKKNVFRNFTIILDYGGNDTYNMPTDRFPAYALGANVIVDFAGDDDYFANSWNLGAGFFGAGILWDKKGNDHYFGDTFTMGAGCFGYGLLLDEAGDDFYQAALFSQGFGFTEGIGILKDLSGNDHYFAGGKYKDILRYSDHYISLSQGFGYGIRPYISGGIGYLVDDAGNDTYESDIFGQGCSYWWSVGILADGGGNDKYLSFQYAQGCATHMTAGCLYDASGDDLYSGKGLMQGEGHDRAVGIIYDAAGNDNYVAHDLSQGAASANGIGILADLEGADSYLVKDNRNTQGYGDPRRDYGSIGVFMDLSGKDSYAGGNGADSTWWANASWGIGLDR